MYKTYDVIDQQTCLHYRIIDDDFEEEITISSHAWEPFLNAIIAVYERRGLNAMHNVVRCITDSHVSATRIMRDLGWQINNPKRYEELMKYMVLT